MFAFILTGSLWWGATCPISWKSSIIQSLHNSGIDSLTDAIVAMIDAAEMHDIIFYRWYAGCFPLNKIITKKPPFRFGATFPVFHDTDYSVVAGVLHEHSVTAHTVRWVVSESLLRRHAGILSAFRAGTAACSGFASLQYLRCLSWECLRVFLNINLTRFCRSPLSLFWPALAESIPAGYHVNSCDSPWRQRYGWRLSAEACPVMCAMSTALNTVSSSTNSFISALQRSLPADQQKHQVSFTVGPTLCTFMRTNIRTNNSGVRDSRRWDADGHLFFFASHMGSSSFKKAGYRCQAQ